MVKVLTITFSYAPTLKIVAVKLRMNEYIAGVVLVAITNSTTDLLVNFSSLRRGVPAMNNVMSSLLTIVLLSGGTVCFIRPFTMNGSHIVRDLLFLLFTIELSRYFIISHNENSWVEGSSMLM